MTSRRPATARSAAQRALLAVVAAVALVAGALGPPAGTALADPAGPTDYRSEVLEVDPPTPTVALDVIGGDAFVRLRAASGTEVVVIGYRGEAQLMIRPDGTVLENRASPSTYVNQDRYGGDPIPPSATPDAAPDWREVGSGGTWSWHDHRAHWMQPTPPAGRGVGDRVVEGVIPLVVDGAEVDVTVVSTWQPEPSPLPAVAGAVAGVALAAVAAASWRRGRRWSLAAVPLAALALVAGAWQWASLPAETGPRLVWWALPAIATAATSVAAVAEVAGRTFLARAAVLVAGAQLVVWGAVKRDGLTAAIVPTGAPGWFDRLATAGALVGGAGLVALALAALFGPLGPPHPVGGRVGGRVSEPRARPG